MQNGTIPAVQTSAAVNMLKGNKVQATAQGGTQYLQFDSKRTGEFLFGRDKEPCTGDVFSLDLQTLQHGWILWHQRKPTRNLVPINQDLPPAPEPIHYTDAKGKAAVDEPSEARSIGGCFEDGTQFIYEVSTYGGRKAVDALLGELFLRANADSPYLFPQVELASDSYDHSTYGTVFEPVLKPVAWFDEQGNEEGATAKIEATPEPQAEPEEEPQEEAAPQRRRRRS